MQAGGKMGESFLLVKFSGSVACIQLYVDAPLAKIVRHVYAYP